MALRLVFDGQDWGGAYFFLGDYDASAAGAVAMRLKMPDEVTGLELKLEGPETNPQSVNLIPHETGRDAAGWRTFSVPLAEFDRIDLAHIAILGLWRPSTREGTFASGELIVDEDQVLVREWPFVL